MTQFEIQLEISKMKKLLPHTIIVNKTVHGYLLKDMEPCLGQYSLTLSSFKHSRRNLNTLCFCVLLLNGIHSFLPESNEISFTYMYIVPISTDSAPHTFYFKPTTKYRAALLLELHSKSFKKQK